MFTKLRKNRRFDYTPRFYNPEPAKPESKKKVRFRRPRRRSGNMRLMIFGAAFLALLYALMTLSQSGQ